MKHWLSLWLCLCLLLSSPVRADCCWQPAAASGATPAAAVAGADEAPCPSHAGLGADAAPDREPAPDTADCDHCPCHSRTAALSFQLPVPGLAPPPAWAPAAAFAGVDDEARIPPSPPPIA